MASREIVRYRSPTRSAVQALTVIFLIVFLIWTVLPQPGSLSLLGHQRRSLLDLR